MTYEQYYKQKSALENVLPSKRDIDNSLPDIVSLELKRIRAIILGFLAELNEEGWDDDD